MRNSFAAWIKLGWIPAATFFLAGNAVAQATSAAPAAPTPLTYKSALENYQPYKDQPVESWREANDNVGRIGGWRVYANEARQPGPERPENVPVDEHAGHHGGKK